MEVTGRESQWAGGDTRSTWQHIEIAEPLERLCLFLTRYIDSCERDGGHMDYPRTSDELSLDSNSSPGHSESESHRQGQSREGVRARVYPGHQVTHG
jgi:hypothetical protein